MPGRFHSPCHAAPLPEGPDGGGLTGLALAERRVREAGARIAAELARAEASQAAGDARAAAHARELARLMQGSLATARLFWTVERASCAAEPVGREGP